MTLRVAVFHGLVTMKRITLRITALAMVLCATAAFSQSKFSGIYNGKASSVQFLLALTKGGHAIGADENSDGFRDVLDPAKSKVSSSGKLRGKTPAGASIVAKITSGGKLSGTLKVDGATIRLSGKRTYK